MKSEKATFSSAQPSMSRPGTLRPRPAATMRLQDTLSGSNMGPGSAVIRRCRFKYDGLGIATLAFNNLSGIGHRGTGVLKVVATPSWLNRRWSPCCR